jgi:thymidylate kinase
MTCPGPASLPLKVEQLSHNQARFIVLEGVNGAGKSAMIDRLKSRPDVHVSEGPRLGMDLIKPTMLTSAAPLARFYFFLARNHQIAAEMAERDEPVRVCSRYLWSSVAYHVAREKMEDLSCVTELLILSEGLPMPHCIVQLDVSPATQASRIRPRAVDSRSRYGVAENSFLDFNQRMRTTFAELRRRTDIPWHVIDTSDLDLDEVAKQVTGYL